MDQCKNQRLIYHTLFCYLKGVPNTSATTMLGHFQLYKSIIGSEGLGLLNEKETSLM